jgi:alpha-galactosidase
VQLDDGYQHAVGDWLELNEKFPRPMAELVQRIRGAGFLPGLWLAPFLLSARSHTFAEHPDWVVRDQHGDPLKAIDNWGTANYAVDSTHPEVLRRLEHVLRTVCEDWGYAYVKLDFLYAAAMRGQRFDSAATGVEAYRRGLALLRRVAGERFILGCGAPLVPSVGLVDGMRIGADVASYWGVEGNADGPALRNAMRATLARLWMHGRWWSNDPDVVVVRANDCQLTLAEVQAWAAVVALSGGMLFEGDDLSRLEPERLELLTRLVPPSGEAARAFPPLVELMSERLVLRVERPWDLWHVVGMANWSDVTREVTFDPRELELDLEMYHLVDLWSGEYLGRTSGVRHLGPLPPHAMRLLSVHADRGRPQTIGSSGHLLGEAMDLTSEEWNPAAGVLKLLPSDRAPRGRRAEFLVYDPRGPLRRIAFSAADVGPIVLHFT